MNTLKIALLWVLLTTASFGLKHRVPSPPPPPTTTVFSDSFNTGTLNTNVWTVSNWPAPSGGTFSPTHVDVSQGLLRLTLTQTINSNGLVQSVGGEIGTKQTFGYGTYDFVVRASSTSPTFDGFGTALSGSITGLFTFVNNSQTEIDFEIEGTNPNIIWLTNYNSGTIKTYSSTFLYQPDSAFHDYKFVWQAGRIDYYIDGVLVSTHTANIPTAPAYIMMNHWGTNSSVWGGLPTIGITRYLYVKSVSFSR